MATPPSQELIERLAALRKQKDPSLPADRLNRPLLALLYSECYQPFANADRVADRLLQVILDEDANSPLVSEDEKKMRGTSAEYITIREFAHFLHVRTSELDRMFKTISRRNPNGIELDDLLEYFDKHNIQYDPSQVHVLYHALDRDGDGLVTLAEFKHQLMLVPMPANDPHIFRDAYQFFVDDLELSSESDVNLVGESHNGFGYFWAGGLAGVVSRTCTAPFDRLKVYLIAHTTSHPEGIPIVDAIKAIYRQGGLRGFFVGNGLNVIKVFPESAMKFGGFESAKRLFAHIEGVEDPADISRLATFVAGGMGGMLSQLCVYPIDTIKFRMQCGKFAKPSAGARSSPALLTIRDMWRAHGLYAFYRGITVGVLGIFPFAALDLGLFSALKNAYISNRARAEHIDPANVTLGNLVVLSMGAISGSIGASVVYPINLLRTRIQTQGTAAHPYTYTGFRDVYRQTIRREGWRGLFRGLGPNLAKVAPSVSISYVVYENAKRLMGLH